VTVIITTVDDEGRHRGAPHELADQVLEVAPEETIGIVKGAVSGIRVSDRAAVLWLMQRYTAAGKPRKGK
jgi:hypothetical protein